ncbi:unnamed protein product, partial [Prunus brigantina]
SGFAVVDRGTTSLNGAWDPEATWLFDHNIFGRALHGPRPRPIRLWSRGREDPAFVFALCFLGTQDTLTKMRPFHLMNRRVKHRHSMPYYPHGNGQPKATNKTLLRILSKMVYEYEGGWSVHLLDALRAYRTSPRSAIGLSPYSLVYGSDTISPVEITIPTTKVLAVNDLEWDTKSCSDWRLLDLKALDEKRVEAERRIALYHKTVAQAYNRIVKPRAFKQRYLVLKVVEHVRRQVSGSSRFALQWEGPFVVKEVYSSGYYRLVSVKEGTLTDPINMKWLKPYYC